MSTEDKVWMTLSQSGLVSGARPEGLSISTPWYIKTLLAVSAWLAAVFLFAFLAVLFNGLLDSVLADTLIGSVFILIAYHVLKSEQSDFVEHLGLAFSIAGQILLIMAMLQLGSNADHIKWLIALGLNVFLIFLIPNFVHRVLSSFLACICLAGCLAQYGLFSMCLPVILFICAWCWIHEFKNAKWYRYVTALGYGSLLSLLLIETNTFFQSGLFYWGHQVAVNQLGHFYYLNAMLTGAVVIYSSLMIINKYQSLMMKSSCYILAFVLVLSGITWSINGMHTSMVVLALGLATTHRILIGLGSLCLLFSISHYYYSLDTTLLMKALSLAILGGVLLGIRWCLPKLFGEST